MGWRMVDEEREKIINTPWLLAHGAKLGRQVGTKRKVQA
jgi:hypothetical protein